MGWNDEHPSVFSVGPASGENMSNPRQPLVFCLLDGVQVPALIDTGSMKSIISSRVFDRINETSALMKKPPPIPRGTANTCVAITGQPLNSTCSIAVPLSFPGSSFMYRGEFLVCANVLPRLDCILGWDFLASNYLQLAVLGDSYSLIGPHGSTPLTPCLPSSLPHTTGLSCSLSSTCTQVGQGTLPVFAQSSERGPGFVTLASDIVIPYRSECVVQANLPRRCDNMVGMICRISEESCITAYTVSKAVDRKVAVRILNPSSSDVALNAGQKIAKFWPVVELTEQYQNSLTSGSDFCASIASLSLEAKTCSELKEALSPSLSESDSKQIFDILASFPDVFNEGLGHTSVLSHHINTGNSTPIRQYPRRLPFHFRGEIDKQVKDMLQQGVVRPSTSPWASPVVLVKKKDGSYRFCVDYRKLNLVTEQDAHPLPRVDDLLDSLSGNCLFSTLDLRSGYWQVSMSPEDQEKTAFITPNGLYEFLRMPYGLCTAPATFTRALSIILSGLSYDICLCYFDDVIIFSKTITEHCKRLRTVLQRFRDHGLRVKASKCSFGADNVLYLGHSISSNGVHTDPAKIKAVQALPSPTNLEHLRSFLGLAGYYRKFIPNFASVASPLTELTKKGVPFTWSTSHQASFLQIKDCLCSAPVLAYPQMDKPFIVQTDASNVGLGAILTQLDGNGNERVVSYASRTLTAREQNFTAMEKEALAVVFATKYFRVYLLGNHFQLVTDNRALKWLHSVEPKGRLARWIMDLQEYNFTVKHRAGSSNQNADALSRLHPTVYPNRISPSDIPVENLPALNCLVSLLPNINLQSAQATDPDISIVLQLKKDRFPKPPLFVWKDSVTLRSFWHCWDELYISDGLLVRNYTTKQGFSRQRIVIPQTLISTLLQDIHSSPSGGHLGITRTTFRAKDRFFWPKMDECIRSFINNCVKCSQSKHDPTLTKAPLKSIEVSEPFIFWALDYMGPLPETAQGNRHILVLMDHFTKWCEAFPTKDQKSSTVANVLVSRVFSRFGPPAVIHSDQGRNFESNLMHEIYNMMGVKKSRTTAYHPQGDGLVERQNRTLQEIISNFVSEHHNNWDLWLDQAVFAYNTSIHESTGLSPYELVFGRPPRMPIEVELGVPFSNPLNQSEYSQYLRKAIQTANALARQQLEKVRKQQCTSYDKSHKAWSPLETGKTVWLRRPKSWKFGRKWVGPYQISCRNGVNYTIRSHNGRSIVAHHNQLKPCPIPLEQGQPVHPTPETPGIVIRDNPQAREPLVEPGTQNRVTVRPAHLRQVINPPVRFGDIVQH